MLQTEIEANGAEMHSVAYSTARHINVRADKGTMFIKLVQLIYSMK
jgi:hypothetical protein